MSLPTIRPACATAFRDWVIACLNLDDTGQAISPAPFSSANVVWTPRDYPRAGNLYCMLREVSLVPLGPPEEQAETLNAGEANEALRLHTRTFDEWTVSVQVVSKLDDQAPALDDAAGRILRRLSMRVLDDNTYAMRQTGLAWRRSGQITPLDRIARASQWETRAAIDLTFVAGESILWEPGWIETVEATGTLAPLPETTINAAHDDDLDDLLE